MLTQNKITHLENWTEELKGIDVLIFEDNIIENRDHFIPLINRKIKNVERLHLGNNGIKSLNWLNFECHRLLVLSLTKNHIRTLPKNLSSHLRFLKYLDLQYNLLTKIDNAMFKGFSRMTDLRLAHNNISEIADGAFMDLSNLISLTFRNNSIATITANTFVGLSSLETLSLTENRLDQISSDAFQATPALENLHLFENTLTSIEIGTFKNLNGLHDLELSNNYITLLNPGVFENLENLTEIKMARNNLEVLKTNSFVNMPKLRLVNIAYNNIKVIEDDAFFSIPHLHEVNLMHNEISVWNPRAFKNIAKIGKINLEGNQLKTIQSQAFHNLNVKFIDFKDNLITKIEVDGFQGLDSLEYLGLSGNSIEELSKEIFNHLGNLKCIDFVNNKVQKTELLQQLPKVQFIFTESDFTDSEFRFCSFVKFKIPIEEICFNEAMLRFFPTEEFKSKPKRFLSSATNAKPFFIAEVGDEKEILFPFSKISPIVFPFHAPKMAVSNSVLPLPINPLIPRISPLKTSNETSSTLFLFSFSKSKTEKFFTCKIKSLRTKFSRG